jgi:hypothetical protein
MELEGENEVFRAAVGDDRTILCRDDGTPYDNLLRIDLLDPEGRVLDSIEAGGLMADGIFNLLTSRRDGFDFSYFANGETYRLECARHPSWRPFLLLPYGFRYKTRLTRHYLVVRTLKTGV